MRGRHWWIRDDCDRVVFRQGDTAIGFAIVDVASPFKPGDADAVLLDFYVTPKVRRLGIGRSAA